MVFILGDQLSIKISSLIGFDKRQDAVLMAELRTEAEYAWHHKKKLVLIFAAMRHFKNELEEQGFKVLYTKFDDSRNTHNFASELDRVATEFRPQKIILTEPSELRVLEIFKQFSAINLTEIAIQSDNRFIASHQDFQRFATSEKNGQKKLLMEHFYRKIRLKTGLLIEEKTSKPIGGKWNFDSQNRQPMPSKVNPPKLIAIPLSTITCEVIELVNKNFPKNFGDTDNFCFATTARDAELHFSDFLQNRLKNFGVYQDAMRQDIEFGFHSVIAIYLNLGLLDPLDCCKRVEKEFLNGNCDLAAAEGFIRQIIGWREYVRGIYWHFMPSYKELNYFNHHRRLPKFYWDENKTEMNCLAQVIKQTRNNAYSHHIQRLMITGNFAMLAEIAPSDVNSWYLAVYADAFDWVELPNTHGMAIYADGGIMASKPYCSSGNYINKMSNFCKNCVFDVKQTTGSKACPFNFLYWNFLIKNQQKLQSNPRLFYPYSNLKRKSNDEISAIQKTAAEFLDQISSI